MLLTGLRWEELGWRDQLDVVEAVLGEGSGIDANLDHVADQIAEMYPEEETWGSSPGARKAQAKAETEFAEIPRVGKPKNPGKTPTESEKRVKSTQPRPAERVPYVRSGNPLEWGLFQFMQRTLMGIPRPPLPPTIVPDA